jgi:hypothetical protein
VVVTDSADSSVVTTSFSITVVTNAQGQYGFPRDRLEPGRYSVAIRAVGYELPGAKTAQVEVTAQQTAALLALINRLDTGHWRGVNPEELNNGALALRTALNPFHLLLLIRIAPSSPAI